MSYREIGGWRVSPVGVGTWQAGSRLWGSTNMEEAVSALVEALTQGINFIDTAVIYGWGRSEYVVGEALRRYGRSQDVLVATKIPGCIVEPDEMLKHAEASRRRLGLDTIGLIQLHWPPSVYTDPCKPIWGLEKIIDAGISHMAGLCNYDWVDLEKALYCTRKHELVSNQVEYSLVQRAPERRLMDMMKKNRMTLIGWGTLAKGALAGKTSIDNLARLLDPSFHFARKDYELHAMLDELASKHNVSKATIAIRWVIEKEAVPLVGIRKKRHVKSIVDALKIRLSSDEVAQLDNLTRKYLTRSFTEVAPKILPGKLICALYRLLV